MQLTEIAPVPASDLPLAELREHLRLGTGFGTDTLQDSVLEQALRAALSVVEGRIARALLARDFRLTLSFWGGGEQRLPVAPIERIDGIAIVDADGDETPYPPEEWRLSPDGPGLRLVARSGALPGLPGGGHVRIDLVAGYGGWSSVPADLRQSVLLLAAQAYETRSGDGALAVLPGVAALLAPYREMRIGARP